MAETDIEAVTVYRGLVSDLLDRAAQAKPDRHIEPPLTESHLGESIWTAKSPGGATVEQLVQPSQTAAVEIAFREKFYSLLVCARTLLCSSLLQWKTVLTLCSYLGYDIDRRPCFRRRMEPARYNIHILGQWLVLSGTLKFWMIS